MPGPDRGTIMVKNTFLEVGDHKSLKERSEGWRRQMSEPVKIYAGSSQFGIHEDNFSELDESEEEDPSAAGAASALFSTAHPPDVDTISAKAPQVVLLSESIPFSCMASKERQDKKDGQSKDQRMNYLKDLDITKKAPPWTDVTTVMMRNLPNKYTQAMLLEELSDAGFQRLVDFDFFYLPMDHSNAANLGYCFINFCKTPTANTFAAAFQGKKMKRFNSNKTVVTMPASIQGFDRNYVYYSSTRVAQAEDPAYRPIFCRRVPTGPVVAPIAVPKASAKNGGAGKGSPATSGKGKKPAWEMTGQALVSACGGMVSQMCTVGAPAIQGQKVCQACSSTIGSAHRFCTFCGSFVGQEGLEGINPGGNPNGSCCFGNVDQAPCSMRADAPTFVPAGLPSAPSPSQPSVLSRQDEEFTGGSGPLDIDVPMLAQMVSPAEPGQPLQTIMAPSRLQTTFNSFRHSESVTDELDVMRGRQMLLDALKDMERREIEAGIVPNGFGVRALPENGYSSGD